MIKRMVKVYLLGLMGINMKAVIRMIFGRVLVICYGMMVASTEVNGRMEFKMERGNWYLIIYNSSLMGKIRSSESIKELIYYSSYLQEVSIKDRIKIKII